MIILCGAPNTMLGAFSERVMRQSVRAPGGASQSRDCAFGCVPPVAPSENGTFRCGNPLPPGSAPVSPSLSYSTPAYSRNTTDDEGRTVGSRRPLRERLHSEPGLDARFASCSLTREPSIISTNHHADRRNAPDIVRFVSRAAARRSIVGMAHAIA